MPLLVSGQHGRKAGFRRLGTCPGWTRRSFGSGNQDAQSPGRELALPPVSRTRSQCSQVWRKGESSGQQGDASAQGQQKGEFGLGQSPLQVAYKLSMEHPSARHSVRMKRRCRQCAFFLWASRERRSSNLARRRSQPSVLSCRLSS